jgi:hypothetical protein
MRGVTLLALLTALNRAINYATTAGSLCVSSAGYEGVDPDSRRWSISAAILGTPLPASPGA